MRVLVADNFPEDGLAKLRAIGLDVRYEPAAKGEALTAAVRDSTAEVLVVRGTEVKGDALRAGRLGLVVRAGAGYNTIDVATASKAGIYVSNCPGKNAVAVAELAFALMLSLDRRIPDNVAALKAHTWNKKDFSKARGMLGRTLGLLGYGNIGQEMARRAIAFGMPVVVWSRRFAAGRASPPEGLSIQIARSPEEVAERADVLSVHLALSAETKGLVNAAVLERLKPGSIFINTARAEVVDYAALERVARERDLRVGLDVYPGEPAGATGEFANSIIAVPNLIGTHHIGASTDQAQEAIAEETVRIIATYRDTGRVPNVVNLAKKTPATHMLVVRHRDRPGVLAHVFHCLRSGDINVQETENVIFEGAEAAVARINLDGAPSDALLKQMQDGNADILDLHLVTI